MKTAKANGISWFLDEEALVPTVRELNELRDVRRGYRTIRSASGTVFVKYFHERGIWGFIRNRIDPRGRREYRMGKKLIACSIATPNPIGYGLGRTGSFALQEWIDAQPLRAAFAEGTFRPELLAHLVDLLLKLKTAGIRHNDLHLDNILVRGKTLFAIDLHKAKIRKTRFPPFECMVNVLHALGPIYRELSEAEKSDFFRLYGGQEIRPSFEKRLEKQETVWVERKKARAFSTTSKLTKAGRRVYIKGAETTGKGAFLECIKNDRKVRVERFSDHLRKIYRDNRRLKKAWLNHVAIEYLDLPIVPKPLYVDRGGLFRSGFIAMEDLRGRGEEMDRYLDRHYDTMAAGRTEAGRFISSIAAFFSMLLNKGILHRDLKACNVFVLEDGFRLLDVEDVVFHRSTQEDVLRMFVQLNTSVPGRISSSHRIRFFSSISRKMELGRPERKRLFAEVIRASARETIVYEGVNGLRKESWTEDPAGHYC